MTASKLTFKKDRMSQAYWADTDLYTFRIRRVSNDKKLAWELTIKHTEITAGVRHSLGQPVVAQDLADTKRQAEEFVAEFLNTIPLTRRFDSCTTQRALNMAISKVYERESAAIVAEYDRMRAQA